MSSSDYLALSSGSPNLRAENLFRAAVSAFSSLTRPSRAEALRLEHLVMPLMPSVPAEALRFAAAALASCREAPAAVIRYLADRPAAIAAPVLMRSSVLTNIDLISLIGRHGLSHALVIARRPDLNADLAQVVNALVAIGRSAETIASDTKARTDNAPRSDTAEAEAVREELRDMMRPAAASRRRHGNRARDWSFAPRSYPVLRSTALSGRRPLFQTALADALDLDFGTARGIVDGIDGRLLVTALRAMDLAPEQAFLLFALAQPGGFDSVSAIAGFVKRFEAMDVSAARKTIDALRQPAMAAAPLGDAANSEGGHRAHTLRA